MNLKEALAAFPPKSPYRKLLPALLDKDAEVRDKAYDRLEDLDQLDPGEDPIATTWKHGEAEALALLNAAVGLPFPPPRVEWEDVVHELIFPLVQSPYPTLAAPAREAYPHLSGRAKCAILALLGACGTREAAEGFMACIREHGWPAGGVYSRVFTELPKLLDHADILFPELIQLAGPCIGGIVDVFLAAVAQGKLDLASGKSDLEAIAPLAVKQLKQVLKAAARYQRKEGVAWRFSEKYWDVRQHAGSWLDIAGYLKSPALDPLLKEAVQFTDPRLAAFAAISVLRRGGKVAKSVLQRIAACPETCELLFELLRGLNKLDLFPPKYRTWDAFAAANMVNWLMYPTELGRQPDQLKKMAVFISTSPEGERALYVWRFRSDDGPWYAGVSGPYLREGEPGPLHGGSTFSRFDKWGQATAEEHAAAVLETLDEWRKAKA
ncbi:MAG TPA: hypothetical protein VEL76_17540 [Gemmataceae bacterium]|nr:hypothetical protein [Gemmataceae bacterium]